MDVKAYAPPAVSLLIGGLLIFLASNIPPGQLPDDPGPGMLPAIAGLGLIIFALPIFFIKVDSQLSAGEGNFPRVLLTVLIVGIYIALIEPIGFPLATLLFLVTEITFIGVRNVFLIIGVSLLVALLIYWMFRFGLEVPLPPTRLGEIVL